MGFYQERDDWIFKERDYVDKVWVEGEYLKCTCGYKEKTGIPCCHLHKIINITRDNLLNYIHERWKVTVGN